MVKVGVLRGCTPQHRHGAEDSLPGERRRAQIVYAEKVEHLVARKRVPEMPLNGSHGCTSQRRVLWDPSHDALMANRDGLAIDPGQHKPKKSTLESLAGSTDL